MRTSLCLLLLAIGSLPLAAQFERREFPGRNMPPEIISPEELPRDIVRVASTHVRVDFENGRTRVLRLSLAAGAALPPHDARAGVLVCIAGCRIPFTLPDSKTQENQRKAGKTRSRPDARRATPNRADGPVEMRYS